MNLASVIHVVRRALPALVLAAGRIPPVHRALVAAGVVLVSAAAVWAATAYGWPDEVTSLAWTVISLAVTVLLAAAGDEPPVPPTGGGGATKLPLADEVRDDTQPEFPRAAMLAALALCLGGCASGQLEGIAAQAGRTVERAAVATRTAQDVVVEVCTRVETVLAASLPPDEARAAIDDLRPRCDEAMRAVNAAREAVSVADAVMGAE